MTEVDPHDPLIEAEAPAPPVAPYRARTLGEQLRLAREGAGLHLPDIAANTRIPERTLMAIEADAYEQLPHPTFAAGFVRSLARAVGVSEAEATARYRAENTRLPPAPLPTPLRAIEPERVPSRSLAWVSGAIVLIAIVGAILWFRRDGDSAPSAPTVAATANPSTAPSTPTPIAPPPSVAAPIVAPQNGPAGAPLPTATAATPPVLGTPGGAVTLTATQDVWLQIRDKASGTRVMSSILTQGQTYGVPPGAMTLWTGRAGALQVRVNGRVLPPLGGLAETVRNVDLDPQALIARTAGTPADAGAPLAGSGPR